MPSRTRRSPPAPAPSTPVRRQPADVELSIMQKIFRLLATLHPEARMRVLGYVCARAETLPVIAAVGGGIEGDTKDEVPQFLFPGHEKAPAA